MNAKLKILRKNSFLGMDRQIDVILDGEIVAAIEEDGLFELELEPGDHTIRFDLKRLMWGSNFTSLNMSGTSKPIEFQINAGETRTVIVKPKTEYMLYHALIFIAGLAIIFQLNLDKVTFYIVAFLLVGLPLILLDRSMLRVSFQD